MNRKIVILAVLCVVFILTTLGSVIYYNSVIDELNAELNSQVVSRANLVIDDLNVEDDRGGGLGNNLHIYGRVYNTGEKNAYNAYLHIVAFNAEGEAIDSFYGFGGVVAGMFLGLDFRLDYTGSPLEVWSIMPIWTDELAMPMNSTLSD